MPGKAVAKVSKGREFDTKQAFATFATAIGKVFTDCLLVLRASAAFA
jgi:hypothetical protein